VSPELIQRLGEPFQTTKHGSGGTGLGLYVSSLLAERMGAVLQLESARGRGARVTLSLQKSATWQSQPGGGATTAGAVSDGGAGAPVPLARIQG
jgi:two-component system sensor histidine kinase RegB